MISDPLSGHIFAVDKPLGWTSFHVVKKLRGALLTRLRQAGVKKLKVGHAGTLDPLATGVMLICCGKYTSRIDELQAGRKTYTATIRLGATTPSFDMETPEDAWFPTNHITRPLVEDVLKRFVGEISQVPPAYSAVKVDGDRAYAKARKGEAVDIKPKILVIDSLELLHFAETEITVRVICSKGTYIRALARDIGAALNSGGYLTALRRDRVGDYPLERCQSIDDAVREILTQPLKVSLGQDLPPVDLPPADFESFQSRGRHEADILPYHMRPHTDSVTPSPANCAINPLA
ncbi:MAG: tRNA pseudouridine(55) synthase TruB [Muribaculaceae bacterium]|nr:tRNA pseudouridine(55) synthase TruB [Muribaculaceae bacterium]